MSPGQGRRTHSLLLKAPAEGLVAKQSDCNYANPDKQLEEAE